MNSPFGGRRGSAGGGRRGSRRPGKATVRRRSGRRCPSCVYQDAERGCAAGEGRRYREKRPPVAGDSLRLFLGAERFACQDASRQREGVEEERLRGGAGAPASAEGAHGEAGQAETAAGPGKATGKRRASGGACPPLACFARRTRSRRAFGTSWFLTPALTRPATSSDALPADTGPRREG